MMMKQVWQLVVVFNSSDGGRLACYQFKRLRSFEFIACLVKPFNLLSFTKMTTKKNAVVKASNSKELACQLSNFNYELDSMNEKSFFILTYDWTNLEKKTSGSKEKIFGLIKDKDERFDFLWFKARREMKKNWSLAIFWSKGLLKTLQEEHYITEELA